MSASSNAALTAVTPSPRERRSSNGVDPDHQAISMSMLLDPKAGGDI
jgi:hypothetical protein